jgi:hypothetical protein
MLAELYAALGLPVAAPTDVLAFRALESGYKHPRCLQADTRPIDVPALDGGEYFVPIGEGWYIIVVAHALVVPRDAGVPLENGWLVRYAADYPSSGMNNYLYEWAARSVVLPDGVQVLPTYCLDAPEPYDDDDDYDEDLYDDD